MIGAATKRLLITPGEPAGIGPELLVRLAQAASPQCERVVVCDPALLRDAATRLGLPLQLTLTDETTAVVASAAGQLSVWSVPLAASSQPGQLDPRNAHYVLDTLRRATAACAAGKADALVTGPIHKGVINEAAAHPHFTGHTEFLAELTAAPLPVMLLAAGSLRVALATTHLPLSAVPSAITRESLTQTLRVLHAGLQNHYFVNGGWYPEGGGQVMADRRQLGRARCPAAEFQVAGAGVQPAARPGPGAVRARAGRRAGAGHGRAVRRRLRRLAWRAQGRFQRSRPRPLRRQLSSRLRRAQLAGGLCRSAAVRGPHDSRHVVATGWTTQRHGA